MTVDFNGNCDNKATDTQLTAQANAILTGSFKKADAGSGGDRRAAAKAKRFQAKAKAERANKLIRAGNGVVNELSPKAEAIAAFDASIAGAYMWGGFNYRDIWAAEDMRARLAAEYDTAVTPARKCFAEAAQCRKDARRLNFSAGVDTVVGAMQGAAGKLRKMVGMK